MTDYYLFIKGLHIIAVIAWMAGMLYLPRLFVYHATVAAGSETSELFKVMERRLMRAIINPAMVVTWILGLWLVVHTNALDLQNGMWMHWKLTLVLCMQGIHALLSRRRKQFLRDENTKTPGYYKVLNETVTVLMIAIVLLVTTKAV